MTFPCEDGGDCYEVLNGKLKARNGKLFEKFTAGQTGIYHFQLFVSPWRTKEFLINIFIKF